MKKNWKLLSSARNTHVVLSSLFLHVCSVYTRGFMWTVDTIIWKIIRQNIIMAKMWRKQMRLLVISLNNIWNQYFFSLFFFFNRVWATPFSPGHILASPYLFLTFCVLILTYLIITRDKDLLIRSHLKRGLVLLLKMFQELT